MKKILFSLLIFSIIFLSYSSSAQAGYYSNHHYGYSNYYGYNNHYRPFGYRPFRYRPFITDPFYDYPVVINQPIIIPEPDPVIYIEKSNSLPQSDIPDDSNYWYYCTDPTGYYPTIKQCPKGWMQVVPNE